MLMLDFLHKYIRGGSLLVLLDGFVGRGVRRLPLLDEALKVAAVDFVEIALVESVEIRVVDLVEVALGVAERHSAAQIQTKHQPQQQSLNVKIVKFDSSYQ